MFDCIRMSLLALVALSSAAPCGAQSAPPEVSAAWAARYHRHDSMPSWIATRLAVQLYSFRAEAEKDLDAALQTLRGLGFTHVELYPVPGVSAPRMRAALRTAGLQAIGAHVPLDSLQNDLEKVIADAKILGVSHMGVPWIKPRTSDPTLPLLRAEADAVIAIFHNVCELLRLAGIHLYLHNHGYEALGDGSQTQLDRILTSVDPRCLDLQVDVFWAATAGMNPAQLIRRYGSRVWSVHLKDRRPGAMSPMPWTAEKRDSVALGDGNLEMGTVLTAAREAHVQSLIIEDELPDSISQVQRSLDYLRGFR